MLPTDFCDEDEVVPSCKIDLMIEIKFSGFILVKAGYFSPCERCMQNSKTTQGLTINEI